MLLIIIALYFGLAYWLYRYFKKNDRGSKEAPGSLRIACYFGLAAALGAGALNEMFVPQSLFLFLEDKGPKPDSLTILIGSLTVGVIEESLKFIPLAIWIYRKKYFNEITDGIIYFGLCGMWFGVLENMTYALTFGGGVGIARLILTPFLHAGFAATIGWGLAQYKLRRKGAEIVVSLFLTAVIIHTLYDFLIFFGEPVTIFAALFLAIAINLGVFALFENARSEDEKLGLSAVGANNFCRNCGKPNDGKYLYCIYCGKKA